MAKYFSFGVLCFLIKEIYFRQYVCAHQESCFEIYPQFNAVDGLVNPSVDNRPNTFYFGNTSGNVKQCEKLCGQEWACVYYTQYSVLNASGEYDGLCYGRSNFTNTMVHVTTLSCISGMKIPCRFDSYIELFDADNVGVHSTGSGAILKTNTPSFTLFGVSSVHVYGPSIWMLYSEANYGGRSLMLNEGYWHSSTFGYFGNNAMKSARRIDTCPDRPIGLQNPFVIPDPSFSQWQALENRESATSARLNYGRVNSVYGHALMEPNGNYPGGWVHDHNNCCDFGIQVDLGQLYRIYAVGTQGTCFCDGVTLNSVYYSSKYRIAYSTDGINYQEVKENGANKIFTGNNASTYKQEIKNTFAKPFVASHVRLIPKDGYYRGLRMEFYGCAVSTAASTPQITDQSHSYTEVNREHITDKNNNTCVDLSKLVLPTVKIPVGMKNKSEISLSLFLAKPCSFDSGSIMVAVHKSPPLQYNQGMFQLCTVGGKSENAGMFDIQYTCTCGYGICESVIIKSIKTQSGVCLTLCDVKLN